MTRIESALTEQSTGAQPITADVAIVGAHATVSLLAAALARGGRSVVLIDDPAAESPPSGLSTTPYSSELALLFADRFGVEEARSISLFETAPASLQAASGVKTNLGFVHHRHGRGHDPHEIVQFHVPSEHAEWQPDPAALDAWALEVADHSGVRVVRAQPLARHARELLLDDGLTVSAGLVIDGSPVAPAGRVVAATELTGVLPFERVVAPQRHGQVRPWSRGTLTHTFPGGYLQVTHNDNHSHATRAGTTVILSVVGDGDPETLFAKLLEESPDLRAQFGRARRTRPWTAVGGAATAVEPGVIALPRLVDPLLSQELTVGLELAHAAAAAILAGRPQVIPARRDALLAHHERLVRVWHGATRTFPMVNASLRCWLLGSILQALSLKRARLDRDWAALDRGGVYWFRVPEPLPEIMDASLADLESAIGRRVPDSVAAGRVFARLRKEKIVPPLYAFGDPEARIYRFTRARRLRMLAWVTLIAPKDFKRLLTAENVSGGRPSARA